ncbi:MAG TPA: hypothetical protein VFF39_10770, partial [Verrucomicrobiae bacterium]|nr:hypothetical protein [Verrucomicrobiae bacterium]
SKIAPENQREKLWLNQSKRGISKTIRRLLSSHLPKTKPPVLKASDLIKLMSTLQSGDLGSITVMPINIPGKIILITEELFHSLNLQEELGLHALQKPD